RGWSTSASPSSASWSKTPRSIANTCSSTIAACSSPASTTSWSPPCRRERSRRALAGELGQSVAHVALEPLARGVPAPAALGRDRVAIVDVDPFRVVGERPVVEVLLERARRRARVRGRGELEQPQLLDHAVAGLLPIGDHRHHPGAPDQRARGSRLL